jgi:putative acetyltransferase
MTIEIRPQSDADAPAVRAVITAAFGDRGGVAGLAEALRARPDRQASLVALCDGRLVGHTHLSIAWVDAPARLVEVLMLSPLSVAPEHQSRGVGTRLLDEVIATAARLGAPLIFLEGDPAYYGPRGWRTAADVGFGLPSTRIPVPGFQFVALDGYDPASMAGAVVCNDTFWSLDFVGLRP